MRAILLAALLACAAQAAPVAEFAAGHEAYRAKDYGKALEKYRAVAAQVRNPVVHYDLACAAFKAGRLGEAILHFEKAHRLAPRDGDIQNNLSFARARVKDAVPEDDGDFVTRLVWGALDRVSMNEIAGLATVLWWLALLAAAALVLARDPARRRALKPVVAAAFVVVACAAVVFAFKYHAEEMTPRAIVLQRELPVLSGPTNDEVKRFTLHEGTKVQVLKRWDRWVHVALPSGENGWAAADGLGVI